MRLIGDSLACVRGGRLVFEDVGFALGDGALMAVTGANGAGKSTLLRLIAGLLRPSAGRLAFEGPGDGDLPGSLHYFGHQDAAKPGFSVRRDLQFWIDYWGGSGVSDPALEAVGLGDLADVPVGVLSAGQRRRLALARLVAVRRPVWLLDEPTSALDAAGAAMLGELLDDHRGRGGLVIAATHQALPRAVDATCHLARQPA